jgi:hypothetical protein
VVDLGLCLAVDLIPLEGIHRAEERLSVYRKVIAVGERQLSGILGGHADEAVDLGHRVQSDLIAHLLFSFLFGWLLSLPSGARASLPPRFFRFCAADPPKERSKHGRHLNDPQLHVFCPLRRKIGSALLYAKALGKFPPRVLLFLHPP